MLRQGGKDNSIIRFVLLNGVKHNTYSWDFIHNIAQSGESEWFYESVTTILIIY